MDEIQIMTNEWYDVLICENHKVYRKTNKDSGSYQKTDHLLIINWDAWGEERFIKMNDMYFKENYDTFTIHLESDDFYEKAMIHPHSKNINLKNKGYSGTFEFKSLKLIVTWNHVDKKEIFNMFNYGKHFSSIINNNKHNISKKIIKNIAIVFPQYHEVEENNKFWGKNFTEWTLLKKMPEKVSELNIKLPHEDIGYYNLTHVNHRKYMNLLADFFNIHGFCYYHYWFKNKKVMYEPLELMLEDGQPDKPFMFCWANEQWTRRWDGGNNEILINQDYSDEKGNIDHFKYLLKFFKHKNYIKINNKPIFIFYRLEKKDKDNIESIIHLWNKLAIENKFSGIYFMRFLGPFDNKLNIEGIEGYVNFEPGYVTQNSGSFISSYDKNNQIFDEYNEEKYLKKNVDIQKLIEHKKISSGYTHYKVLDEKEKLVRCSKFNIYDGNNAFSKLKNQEITLKNQNLGIFIGWNNSPRRNFKNENYNTYPMYYKNITHENFGDTYQHLLEKSNNNNNTDTNFLFITSWNEWNEQSSLEPNHIDGYNYLLQINKKYQDFYQFNKNKKVLIFSHKGGGTEKYINDLKDIFIKYEFIYFDDRLNINKNYNLNDSVDFIHINSFVNMSLENHYVNFFSNYFIGIKKILTIHDYQWIFPNDPNVLCFNLNSSRINKTNINNFIFLLDLCSVIIFPSYNILKNYSQFINLDNFKNKIKVIHHNDKIINHNHLFIPIVKDKINISFIGNFIDYKGSSIFKQLFNNLKYYNGYLIHYHVFGYLSDDENKNKIHNEYFKYHKHYDDNTIINDLHQENIHGIVHLSLFEESYCYALTNSINSGIPILYINHGAFYERLEKKNKYFPTNMDDLLNNYQKMLNFIINNQNSTFDTELINLVTQPKKWYLENYN